MLVPDFKRFEQLAQHSTLVPVSRTVVADLQTPVSAFLSVAATEPHAFLLESVEGGEKIGRFTFLGFRPYMLLEAREQHITITHLSPGGGLAGSGHRKNRKGARKEREHREGNIFEVLGELLGEHRAAHLPHLPPFTGGAVGYLAYDAVRQLEKLSRHAKADLDVADAVFMFFNRLLVFDHLRHQIHIIAAADVRHQKPRRAYDRAIADIAAIERKLSAGFPAPRSRPKKTGAKLRVKAVTSRRQFIAGVKRIKEYIAAGDVFQAVLSQRLDFEPGVPPLDIYRALRTINPSPYMYFLRMGETHVLGSSPEMLVKVTGRKLEYHPIAGTLPRGVDEAHDKALASQLLNDPKERAEHVMLVDLGRNDLGRISEYGSVKVSSLMQVERYSHVMHLVSSIEGVLREGLEPLDALAACFPAGTLSGAPKVRAMEIIEELEPVRRGIYGGSILYADFAGNLNSCIAIRTMLMQGKKAYVQAGAGIVADSDPASEYQESMNKAKAIVDAVKLCRRAEAR